MWPSVTGGSPRAVGPFPNKHQVAVAQCAWTPPERPSLACFRDALRRHQPRLVPPGRQVPAAVAAILHQHHGPVELLFIERSEHPGDPWSGHLAFPGGRQEGSDSGARAAAERETREEIGIDLAAGEYLGRLDDVGGQSIRVVVSAFVYAVETAGPLVLSDEVRQGFWVPTDRLAEPSRHLSQRFALAGRQDSRHPAVDLLGPGRPVLWGITYRLTRQLLGLAGLSLPDNAPETPS